jgi:hypothetical protein
VKKISNFKSNKNLFKKNKMFKKKLIFRNGLKNWWIEKMSISKSVREADHCYVLMTDKYRISRNRRAKWYFDSLHKNLTVEPFETLVSNSINTSIISIILLIIDFLILNDRRILIMRWIWCQSFRLIIRTITTGDLMLNIRVNTSFLPTLKLHSYREDIDWRMS